VKLELATSQLWVIGRKERAFAVDNVTTPLIEFIRLILIALVMAVLIFFAGYRILPQNK
jgi:hypothetical protein